MQNTIILETCRKEIPVNIDVAFILDLIEKDRPIVEYLGSELDNDLDYISPEMQLKINRTTFITINFESVNEINYNYKNPDEVYKLITKYLSGALKSEIEIESDEKDITVYL